MSAAGSAERSLRVTAAGWRARLRATHPTTVLRWLRAGVLAMVLVTALLYLLVSAQAGRQIAAAKRTDAAIRDLHDAQGEAAKADEALVTATGTGEVALIGTGSEFANATARVYSLVTSATEGNADGQQGMIQIQFVQHQLTTYVQQANDAVRDYDRSGAAGLNAARQALTALPERDRETGEVIPYTGGLMASLADLEQQQRDALDRQRNSNWLDPAHVWSLLVGPTVVMLLCVLATGYVVARHFRRYLGPRLPLALLGTAAVGATTSVLCRYAAGRLTGSTPFAAPATTGIALAVLAAAGVLAWRGYRSRLVEYRFPRS
ncbi:hypothetical protein RKE30_30715 [Streptomyces sp. Li-HN-5-11]|uniref:hypothetical protein n=1 Tax=Streptomyces sp. Li-HN-5-11 TaxID=3075432 RepID=UPI0028AA4FAA|nr:hypothetical protein [Streptomyces sp. Li-HN-5-11]WNM34427.1 hypothetical protein RKE30_30715 [Streptomyces sp. Li-HN-5-11]